MHQPNVVFNRANHISKRYVECIVLTFEYIEREKSLLIYLPFAIVIEWEISQ